MRITQRRELQPKAIGISTAVVAFILAGAPAAAGQSDGRMAANRVVNCDAGQSIKQALRRAEPGATIVVRGTCRERVVITQPVTLDGGLAWTMVAAFRHIPDRMELRLPAFLMTRGPYSYSRNPMYASELVLWLGWAAFYGSVAVLINPTWMAWSSMPLPAWLRWTAVAFLPLGAGSLVSTFRMLGPNLTDTVVTRRSHTPHIDSSDILSTIPLPCSQWRRR